MSDLVAENAGAMLAAEKAGWDSFYVALVDGQASWQQALPSAIRAGVRAYLLALHPEGLPDGEYERTQQAAWLLAELEWQMHPQFWPRAVTGTTVAVWRSRIGNIADRLARLREAGQSEGLPDGVQLSEEECEALLHPRIKAHARPAALRKIEAHLARLRVADG